MSIASIGAIGQQGQQNPTGHDAFGEIDLNDFIKLMVTELQNQDPLDPMDNAQILQQMSQIRSIKSNDRLTDTLEAVFLAQNVSTGSGMIGDWVMWLDKEGDAENVVKLIGEVDRVVVENGVPKLGVGNSEIPLTGDRKLQVLSESLGTEIQQTMKMIGEKIKATTTATAQSPSREVTGRVYQISLENGDPARPKLHIRNDVTDQLYVIDSGALIEVLSDTMAIDTGNQGG